MALDFAQIPKTFRFDNHLIMALAIGLRARMSGVPMRIIAHFQVGRMKIFC